MKSTKSQLRRTETMTYLTRNLPVQLHERLHLLAIGYNVTMETIVNAALKIGAKVLTDRLGRKESQ